MATAQFNYNTNTKPTIGDWFSDTFLGTANQQYKQNLAMLNEQNRFSEYMSNTAYQRGTADMMAAGINPAIMYSNGSGSPAAATSSASQSAGYINTANSVFGKLFKRIGNTLSDNIDFSTNKQQRFNNALSVLSALNK